MRLARSSRLRVRLEVPSRDDRGTRRPIGLLRRVRHVHGAECQRHRFCRRVITAARAGPLDGFHEHFRELVLEIAERLVAAGLVQRQRGLAEMFPIAAHLKHLRARLIGLLHEVESAQRHLARSGTLTAGSDARRIGSAHAEGVDLDPPFEPAAHGLAGDPVELEKCIERHVVLLLKMMFWLWDLRLSTNGATSRAPAAPRPTASKRSTRPTGNAAGGTRPRGTHPASRGLPALRRSLPGAAAWLAPT